MGTALVVLAGPLLLCHPLVQKAHGTLAILEVQGSQTPEMHFYHRQESWEGLEALEALRGQVDPSHESQLHRHVHYYPHG